MRPLEILTPIILAIHLLYPLTGKKRPFVVGILPAVTLVVIVIHAGIEGTRLQMIPLYAFAVVTFLLSIPTLLKTQTGRDSAIRPLRIILNLILLAASTALPILLPVPSIPTPSGPYQVGTRIYELTDSSRKELYSGKDEARRFQIQVWYPAEASSSVERAPWMAHADIYGRAISEFLKLPSYFLDHLALVKMPAYKDAPIAQTNEQFPIILFSHGWKGFDAQNSSQALQLASHGYVVIGVQHTYGAIVTVFTDGTIANNNPTALPTGVSDEEYDIAAYKLADQWAGDLAFVLDFLEKQNRNADSLFHNALDLSLVGVYGHSTGGGAAIQFCGMDARCKALVGLDPFMRLVSQQVLDNGVTQPSFFMFSQVWADDVNSRNNKSFDPFYAKSKKTYGEFIIEGTTHYDFSDLPLLTPLAPQLKLKGPINGKRVTVIINDYLLSFFDMTLKDKPTDLFDKSSPYKEIKVKECSCQ